MRFLIDSDLFKNVLSWDLTGEVIVSLIVMGVIAILCLIIFIQCKTTPVLKQSKGLLSLFEIAVEKIHGIVKDSLGPAFENSFAEAFVVCCFLYIPFCFIFGCIGFPCPVSSLTVTLSLALITFTLIHITSIKYTKWSYFKRYIDPIPFFLPINLISMWSPLLSLSLRLFGNGLSGFVLMSLIYQLLQMLGDFIFKNWGSIFFAPILTPVFHAYFDLFSGAIQTIVFTSLSMLFIAAERPEEEVETQAVRTSNRDIAKMKEA